MWNFRALWVVIHCPPYPTHTSSTTTHKYDMWSCDSHHPHLTLFFIYCTWATLNFGNIDDVVSISLITNHSLSSKLINFNYSRIFLLSKYINVTNVTKSQCHKYFSFLIWVKLLKCYITSGVNSVGEKKCQHNIIENFIDKRYHLFRRRSSKYFWF